MKAGSLASGPDAATHSTSSGQASSTGSGQAPSAVKIAQTDAGSVVRIEGRGTMQQSPTVHEFISRLLGAEAGSVVLDLNACTFLDSTFLGSLLDLHKRFGVAKPPRFTVAATPGEARKLFGPTRLDRLLNIAAICPLINGEWRTLPAGASGAREVARHVMECHRALAEVEGPNQAVFARIADQMEREIGRGSSE